MGDNFDIVKTFLQTKSRLLGELGERKPDTDILKNLLCLYVFIESKMIYNNASKETMTEIEGVIPKDILEDVDYFGEKLFHPLDEHQFITPNSLFVDKELSYLGVSSVDVLDVAVDPSSERIESLVEENRKIRQRQKEEKEKSKEIYGGLSEKDLLSVIEAEAQEDKKTELEESQPGGRIYREKIEEFLHNGFLQQAGLPIEIIKDPHVVFAHNPMTHKFVYCSINSAAIVLVRNLVMSGQLQIEMRGITANITARDLVDKLREDLEITRKTKDYLIDYATDHGGMAALSGGARTEAIREAYGGDKQRFMRQTKYLVAISQAVTSKLVMQAVGVDERNPLVSMMKQAAQQNPVYRAGMDQMYDSIERQADEIFGE